MKDCLPQVLLCQFLNTLSRMLSLGALVPEDLTVRSCNKTWTLLSSNTWHSPTHPNKYTLTPPVMCSHQLSVLHWINDSLKSNIYITDFHSVLASQKLLTCRSHTSLIRLNKTNFFPWDTKNTDRYGLSKIKMNTTHSEKNNIGRG